LQVENHDRAVSPAVTDESTSRLRSHCDTVRDLLPGYVGNGLPRFGVDHHRVGTSRNVQPVRFWIDGEIIPSALPADAECLVDLPVALRLNRHKAARQEDR